MSSFSILSFIKKRTEPRTASDQRSRSGTDIDEKRIEKRKRQRPKNLSYYREPVFHFISSSILPSTCNDVYKDVNYLLIVIIQWHGLSREEQAKYYEKARVERQKHMQMYPHWNARDNYRFGLKKKKRKRDKADDPGLIFSFLSLFVLFSGTNWAAKNRPNTTKWPRKSASDT